MHEIGEFVNRKNIRVSMHPGQYTVLNSPHRSVASAARAELIYHADFLDGLQLDLTAKIVLHVGGVYGNRDGSRGRFLKRFKALPSNVRSRVVLENDERGYGTGDVLSLTGTLGIPMVFDYLHHIAYSGQSPTEQLLKRVYESWSRGDGRPELHYSTQKVGSRAGSHADMIDAKSFVRFLQILPQADVDVMLEAKSKDLALLRLRQQLPTWRRNSRGWIVH